MTVIFDASYSGNWLGSLVPEPGMERINIASTPIGEEGLCALGGMIGFSQFFVNHVFRGRNI